MESSKPPPAGQRAEQGQLPVVEIMRGEMMALDEQHLQTNYGRVFGPASASLAQPGPGGGPDERHGSILDALPGLLCLQHGASCGAGKQDTEPSVAKEGCRWQGWLLPRSDGEQMGRAGGRPQLRPSLLPARYRGMRGRCSPVELMGPCWGPVLLLCE